MEFSLEELKERNARWTDGEENYVSPSVGLSLFRIGRPTEPRNVMSEPSLCLIAHYPKRDHLPLVGGRARISPTPDRHRGQSGQRGLSSYPLDQGELLDCHGRRRTGLDSPNESLDLLSTLSLGHCDESAAVPETHSTARG